jgi:hypothetical protein
MFNSHSQCCKSCLKLRFRHTTTYINIAKDKLEQELNAKVSRDIKNAIEYFDVAIGKYSDFKIYST